MDGAQINTAQIVEALITEVIIPELAHLFGKLHGGEPVDEAAARAELQARCAASIARAQAFLAATADEDEDDGA